MDIKSEKDVIVFTANDDNDIFKLGILFEKFKVKIHAPKDKVVLHTKQETGPYAVSISQHLVIDDLTKL